MGLTHNFRHTDTLKVLNTRTPTLRIQLLVSSATFNWQYRLSLIEALIIV